MPLKLVSDQKPVRDALPDVWLRAGLQWQIVWLRSYAAGLNALADIANAQLAERRPKW